MKSSVLNVLVIAILLVPLSGCPLLSLQPGVWLFSLSETYNSPETALSVTALELLEGGGVAAVDPLPEGATQTYLDFLAELNTWSQDGSMFRLSYTFEGHTVVREGRLASGSRIVDGIHYSDGVETYYFTAERL